MINPIFWLLIQILNIYWWIVIAAVIVSWLVSFGVLNTYNPFARSLLTALHALTEPVFRPIRRVIPPLGGLDFSPLIALLGVTFLQYVVQYVAYRMI